MTATSAIRVEVPDIGDFEDVPVIEILISPGDTVALDDPLLTLESDKATMDVPAPMAGTVRELQVKVGDRVSQGTPLLTIEPSDAAASAPSQASAIASGGAPTEAAAPDAVATSLAAEPTAPPPVASPEPPTENGRQRVYASPAVRRLARERGVDLTAITGTGRKGRITKEDVVEFLETEPARPASRRRLRLPVRVSCSTFRPGQGRTSRSSDPWNASSGRGFSASRRPTWPATG